WSTSGRTDTDAFVLAHSIVTAVDATGIAVVAVSICPTGRRCDAGAARLIATRVPHGFAPVWTARHDLCPVNVETLVGFAAALATDRPVRQCGHATAAAGAPACITEHTLSLGRRPVRTRERAGTPALSIRTTRPRRRRRHVTIGHALAAWTGRR